MDWNGIYRHMDAIDPVNDASRTEGSSLADCTVKWRSKESQS